MKMKVRVLLLVLALLAIVVNGDHGNSGKPKQRKARGLEMNFYRRSCPQFENIVRDITWSKVKDDATMAAKLLRLHYHDCFVRGCDASILLDEVNGNNATEKTAGPNRSIAGYEVIDEIKAKLEQVCPRNVSCADIVAVAARDAVSYKKKALWPVYTGRRDGSVSVAAEASRDLPSGGSNFTTLLDLFKRFNLKKVDLVALSGAHTIGVARCVVFQRRVLNFTGVGDSDPDLSAEYAQVLKTQCTGPGVTAGLDRDSSLSFDSHYYYGLTRKEGLLTSDAALLKDRKSRNLVNRFKDPRTFSKAFAASMVNMGKIGVLTGDAGQIRLNCRSIN